MDYANLLDEHDGKGNLARIEQIYQKIRREAPKFQNKTLLSAVLDNLIIMYQDNNLDKSQIKEFKRELQKVKPQESSQDNPEEDSELSDLSGDYDSCSNSEDSEGGDRQGKAREKNLFKKVQPSGG